MPRIAAPRYTQVPFPPYAFVPGRNPHPHLSPKGHRFQPDRVPGQTPRLPPPERWRESTVYLLGCDLYNHAYWWEAHEAWETLWRLTARAGTQGRFLKTLIQVTASHLILSMGKAAAAAHLLARARSNADHVCYATPGPSYMGVPLRAWMDQLDQYYATRLRDPSRPPRHDPSSYPTLRLQLD